MITVFKDIPVQVCQFHQMKNVTKYLTRKPETEAGKELRSIILTLPRSNEKDYTKLLLGYKKVHSLSYLFTYERHQELNILKTTNSLGGSFVHLKDKVNILRKDRRYKVIEGILKGRINSLPKRLLGPIFLKC